MAWYELEREAKSQGKAGFLTWSKAKRDGVDPTTLVADERKRAGEFKKELAEYKDYVLSGRIGNTTHVQEEAREDPDERLVSRAQVKQMLHELVEANTRIGLRIPKTW